LCVEHLLRQGGGIASTSRYPGSRRLEEHRLGVIHLRVPEFHHSLLDAVQLAEGSQLADITADIVGDVILEGHQGSPLTLVADQGRSVLIALGPAD
jgi:hypothetical protein